MRWILLAAAVLAGGLALAGCGDKPSKKDCQKLLAQVIEINTAIPTGQRLSPQQKKKLATQQAAMKKELSEGFLDRCQDEMTVAAVRCQIKARTEADLGKCESE